MKEKRDQNQTFLHESWLNSQKLWQADKMTGGVQNYIKLSIIQDQPEHTSSIRLNLAREWRSVVQTSKPWIFTIPDFTICKGCNTAAKVLISPQ